MRGLPSGLIYLSSITVLKIFAFQFEKEVIFLVRISPYEILEIGDKIPNV